MRKYTTFVTSLGPRDVFVFGSNGSGFHGAGSAGYAMRGTTANTWRDDPLFLNIKSGRCPDRRGKWAEFGIARGFQEGKSGCSYAIQTVERPGHQGCITLRDVYSQLRVLLSFAESHSTFTYFVTKLGADRSEGGYSYFGSAAMRKVFKTLHKNHIIPDNLILPEEYDPRDQ